MAGSILTFSKTEANIKLPELNFSAYIFAPFHITSQESNYNVIFGQDFQWELGINLDFQNNIVGWNEIKISMKSINQFCNSRKSMEMFLLCNFLCIRGSG